MSRRDEFETRNPRPHGVGYNETQDRYGGLLGRDPIESAMNQASARRYQEQYEAWTAEHSLRPSQKQLAAGREAFEAMHAGPPATWPDINEFLTALYGAMERAK